jgi:glycosyltransferase involved in cell wall biosynthesis
MPTARIPIVVSFHGADVSGAISDGELDAVCRHSALLLHRSDSLRAALLARGVPASKMRANPTGVPVPKKARRLEIGGGRHLRLLQACRFIEKKGMDVTLKASKALVDRGFDVCLTLAGDGPQKEELESMVEALGLSSRVKWAGFLTPDRLAEEYQRHDFFLYFQRIDNVLW